MTCAMCSNKLCKFANNLYDTEINVLCQKEFNMTAMHKYLHQINALFALCKIDFPKLDACMVHFCKSKNSLQLKTEIFQVC